MVTKTINILFIIIGSIFVAYVIISINMGKRINRVEEWFAAKSGKYCYEDNNIPKTVKYPVRFDSLEECLKFVNNN